MSFDRLAGVLGPLYKAADTANRWDQAERVATTARRWLDEHDAAAPLDRDVVLALSYLIGVREHAVSDVKTRSAIEACFAEAAWPPLKIRQLIHSLERLPLKPQTAEEKLVADAFDLTFFGMLGFSRQLASGGATGTPLRDVAVSMRKSLGRRFFTPEGQRDSAAPRDELRELLGRLQRIFDAGRR